MAANMNFHEKSKGEYKFFLSTYIPNSNVKLSAYIIMCYGFFKFWESFKQVSSVIMI